MALEALIMAAIATYIVMSRLIDSTPPEKLVDDQSL
jgi:hypothetical protein